MRKSIGVLIVIYGVALSIFFGWWALRDNSALEAAVKLNAPHQELTHRINVFAEGVWFLLSNLITIQGISILIDKRNHK